MGTRERRERERKGMVAFLSQRRWGRDRERG
jgi:hypothetical protein